jgi:hypothetical protein
MGEAHAGGIWLKARAVGQFLPAFDVRVNARTGPEDALRRFAVGSAFLPKVALDVFGGEAVRTRARVRATKGRVSVVVASAKDAEMEASGVFRSVKGQGESGEFQVRLGPLHLVITLRGGETSVKLAPEADKSPAKRTKHPVARRKR